MRIFPMTAMMAAALALAGCNSGETYQVGATEAYATLTSAGYAEGINPLPTGLLMKDVSVSFESIPTDSTGYWRFTRNGKELGRMNVAVTGDETSSTISYSYAKGEISAEDEKIERQIRASMQLLIPEVVDARMEKRPFDRNLKTQADANTSMALMGDVFKGVSASMDEHIANSKMREKLSDAESGSRTARYTSTKPTTDLSKF